MDLARSLSFWKTQSIYLQFLIQFPFGINHSKDEDSIAIRFANSYPALCVFYQHFFWIARFRVFAPVFGSKKFDYDRILTGLICYSWCIVFIFENTKLSEVNMELLYKKVDEKPFSSFYINRVKEPVLDINWHFHKEFELIYIIRGLGIRLVGDNLSSFNSGELVLVGPNLPHLWRTTGNISSVDRIIIKFDEMPVKINLFSLPEFSSLRILFKEAEMGISFGSDTENKVREQIIDLASAEGIQKWIKLLTILEILSKSTDKATLSNPFMKLSLQDLEENRLAKVLSYVSENYNRDIILEDVAKIASMTPQSFCRFFKKRTNKTFVQFLNEYRIGKACVLLIENRLSVNKICDDSGFNSITNFNRFFKRQCNFSPVEYRKKYCAI